MSLNCSDQDAVSQFSKSFLWSHKGKLFAGTVLARSLVWLLPLLGENGPLCISVAVGQRPVLKVLRLCQGYF